VEVIKAALFPDFIILIKWITPILLASERELSTGNRSSQM
jgi:hypothetical protein